MRVPKVWQGCMRLVTQPYENLLETGLPFIKYFRELNLNATCFFLTSQWTSCLSSHLLGAGIRLQNHGQSSLTARVHTEVRASHQQHLWPEQPPAAPTQRINQTNVLLWKKQRIPGDKRTSPPALCCSCLQLLSTSLLLHHTERFRVLFLYPV